MLGRKVEQNKKGIQKCWRIGPASVNILAKERFPRGGDP